MVVSLKFANLNPTLNEMKVMIRFIEKNSYLSDLTSVLDNLKFIGKFFQRSTTSLLMTSSNSIDFEGELRFEVKNFVFKFFLKLSGTVSGCVSGSRQWVCRLQGICQFQ